MSNFRFVTSFPADVGEFATFVMWNREHSSTVNTQQRKINTEWSETNCVERCLPSSQANYTAG